MVGRPAVRTLEVGQRAGNKHLAVWLALVDLRTMISKHFLFLLLLVFCRE